MRDDERDRSVPEREDYYGENSKFHLDNYDNDDTQIFSRTTSVDEDDTYVDLNELINSYSGGSSHRERPVSSEQIRRRPEANQRTNEQRNKSKKKKHHTGLKVCLALILAIILCFTGMFESILSKITYKDKSENIYVSSSDLMSSDKVKNILLLGVDARSGEDDEASRADSMMLISVDTINHTIKLTSFLRDSWVYIPCVDKKQRLNAACSYGGYQGVVDTIEYNFGIKIDGYVIADFEMFKVMVDSIGGVTVDVTEEEANEVTNHKGRYGDVTLESGEYKLTGEQALAYCRIRKIDTDWKRTERQRTVITAIIKQTIKSGPIGAYKMASNVAPYIETTLTKSELKSIFFKALKCVSGDFETQTCPADGTWEYANKGGASVIALNKDKNKEIIQNFIYE